MEPQTKFAYQDGEIDLLELLRSLWKQKLLILLVTLISVIIGFAYIFFKEPVYEVQAYILPPDSAEIESLNYGRLSNETLLKPFDVKEVYETFTRVLLAESTKYSFFSQVYLPSLSIASKDKLKRGTLYKNFKSTLMIKEIPKSVPTQYVLTMRGVNANRLSLWGHQYVHFANKLASEQLLHVVHQQQKNLLHELQQEIDSAREMAKEIKLDSLAKLNEALNIAQATGLNEPSGVIAGGVIVQGAKLDDPGLMYSRGVKALTAEIKNINNRNSDELFVPALHQLQNKYMHYKKITINSKNFHMFYLDGVMTPPDLPIAPQKSLILVLSIILGLICGVAISVVRGIFRVKSVEEAL